LFILFWLLLRKLSLVDNIIGLGYLFEVCLCIEAQLEMASTGSIIRMGEKRIVTQWIAGIIAKTLVGSVASSDILSKDLTLS
jgi:hypothetical protein